MLAQKEGRNGECATYSPDLAQVPCLNTYYVTRPAFKLLPKTAPELPPIPKTPP
jgi:hypothetical protein